jgi:hypothetical protein
MSYLIHNVERDRVFEFPAVQCREAAQQHNGRVAEQAWRQARSSIRFRNIANSIDRKVRDNGFWFDREIK